MSIKAVEYCVIEAESKAADVNGNMQEAAYLIDGGRLDECVERLKWAKENARMLPFRIDEALTAALRLQAVGGAS